MPKNRSYPIRLLVKPFTLIFLFALCCFGYFRWAIIYWNHVFADLLFQILPRLSIELVISAFSLIIWYFFLIKIVFANFRKISYLFRVSFLCLYFLFVFWQIYSFSLAGRTRTLLNFLFFLYCFFGFLLLIRFCKIFLSNLFLFLVKFINQMDALL